MHHLGLNLHEAVQWVADRHEQTLGKFWETREKVLSKDGYPSYGPELDRQVAEYTGVIADWIRGNYEWSWHSSRLVLHRSNILYNVSSDTSIANAIL